MASDAQAELAPKTYEIPRNVLEETVHVAERAFRQDTNPDAQELVGAFSQLVNATNNSWPFAKLSYYCGEDGIGGPTRFGDQYIEENLTGTRDTGIRIARMIARQTKDFGRVISVFTMVDEIDTERYYTISPEDKAAAAHARKHNLLKDDYDIVPISYDVISQYKRDIAIMVPREITNIIKKNPDMEPEAKYQLSKIAKPHLNNARVHAERWINQSRGNNFNLYALQGAVQRRNEVRAMQEVVRIPLSQRIGHLARTSRQG